MSSPAPVLTLRSPFEGECPCDGFMLSHNPAVLVRAPQLLHSALVGAPVAFCSGSQVAVHPTFSSLVSSWRVSLHISPPVASCSCVSSCHRLQCGSRLFAPVSLVPFRCCYAPPLVHTHRRARSSSRHQGRLLARRPSLGSPSRALRLSAAVVLAKMINELKGLLGVIGYTSFLCSVVFSCWPVVGLSLVSTTAPRRRLHCTRKLQH